MNVDMFRVITRLLGIEILVSFMKSFIPTLRFRRMSRKDTPYVVFFQHSQTNNIICFMLIQSSLQFHDFCDIQPHTQSPLSNAEVEQLYCMFSIVAGLFPNNKYIPARYCCDFSSSAEKFLCHPDSLFRGEAAQKRTFRREPLVNLECLKVGIQRTKKHIIHPSIAALLAEQPTGRTRVAGSRHGYLLGRRARPE
jgi:hypothetical protein